MSTASAPMTSMNPGGLMQTVSAMSMDRNMGMRAQPHSRAPSTSWTRSFKLRSLVDQHDLKIRPTF
jgi:hypothetical protein